MRKLKEVTLLRSAKLSTLGFMVILALAALRAYQYPAYNSDEFQYMANAVAMHGAHPPEIHDTVYGEARAHIPRNILDHLLGKDPVETAQSRSYQERAANPYRFAQFLPCFAVRPLFNETVYVLHYWLGVGLLRATVFIPVFSYWIMGALLWAWISRYVVAPWAAVVSLLLMLTPPIWDLARWPLPDGLSCLILLLALYLILEQNRIVLGMTVLLASVYVRTDNMLLVLTVLGYLSVLNHTIEKPKAAVLAAVAVGSVFLINHFAGDYGAKLLYYRAFVSTPMAPGELVPQVGWHDYLRGFRAGMVGIVHGNFIVFGLMGLLGWLKRPSRAISGLAIVTVVYSVVRFLIFPLADERYFALFFVATGILLASVAMTPPESALGPASASS
ncbi:MAG TPA: hypothetical protein VKG65_09130 [Terriglobales bacterium]|nr:hypothetical protein [Terriglobales bacterium]